MICPFPEPPAARKGWPWTAPDDTPVFDPGRSWPRITIVTPSFNQGAFIEETIRSVLLQGYPNLEYIVIDGGSTDGTVEILRKYEPWLAHWESESDRGQSHAINKGINRATGEWFNWLNSDDYFLPGALFEMSRCFAPDKAIISGRTANLRESQLTGTYACSWKGALPESLFFLGVNQPGSLLRLDAVRAAGGVREDLHYTMDLDLWLRILLHRGASCLTSIESTVAVYRYHEQSKTCSGHDIFAAEELTLLLDLFRSLSATVPVATLFAADPGPSPFDTNQLPAWPAETLVRALLDRLIVKDSLLFRGLWRQTADAGRAMATFRTHLNGLLKTLNATYGSDATFIRANALVRAMEATDRLHLAAAWDAVRLAPSKRVVRALLRLMARRFRS